jgi:hypothetical protein
VNGKRWRKGGKEKLLNSSTFFIKLNEKSRRMMRQSRERESSGEGRVRTGEPFLIN